MKKHFSLLFLAAATLSACHRDSAPVSGLTAVQAEVTPYEALQTRLELHPGQTFLTFMQEQVKPSLDAYQDVIVNDPAFIARKYKLLQEHLLEQGAGVAIRIDASSYIFNVGYLNGSDPQNDVRSGRSYGVSADGTQSDPSDLAYLRELDAYLQDEPGSADAFYRALMLVLTNCDGSGWSKLSVAGQKVATDFLAIYTAELDRHLMVDLDPRRHPWEIDLAATTFVSVFNVKTGLMMENGQFVSGGLEKWWGPGITRGSGIGMTRRDRRALQELIASYVKETPESKRLASLVGANANADVIQATFEFLASHNAPQSMSASEVDSLTTAMTAFLNVVKAHAPQIAADAQN